MAQRNTQRLPAWHVLTVTADANSSGTVRRLAESGDNSTSYAPEPVAANSDLSIGPFTKDRSYEILSFTARLACSISEADIDPFAIATGTSLGTDEETYAGAHSYQPVGPDLNLDADAGSTADDPKFLAAVMGNVLGDSLTKAGAYLAGLIGAFSITGTKASHWPTGGVLGIIMDGVTEADGAVVAHLDGDSAQTNANAAFKAMMKNTTPGSGFDYGLDLYLAGQDDFPALAILKALERSPNEVCRLEGNGAPTDAGTGFAGKGSQYTDFTNANLYLNAGDKTTPSWKLVTRAS